MNVPFEDQIIDVRHRACEECGGGLVQVPEEELIGSIDALGVSRLWHAECAPRELRRVLLWARSREKAQWN